MSKTIVMSPPSRIRKARMCFHSLLLAIVSVGFSAAASAQGAVGNVIVTAIAIDTHDANMAFISVNAPKRGNPGCSTSSWAFVLPLTTPQQTLMFNELLEARKNQSIVSLGGSGTCDTNASVETLTYIYY